MAILVNFETTMIKKQSMVILVNYKDNYDTTTTTANKSMGFDLSAIQSCFRLKCDTFLLEVEFLASSLSLELLAFRRDNLSYDPNLLKLINYFLVMKI